MRFLRRSLVGLFLAALTVGLLAYAADIVWSAVEARLADTPPAPKAEERVVAASVVTVTPETATPTLTAYGEVQSRRSLDIRAEVSGRIVRLADGFEDGGRVEKGDLLVRLDPADAESALSGARTDTEEAEAERADARRGLSLARDDLSAAEDQARLREKALERQRDLADRGVGTEAAVETAELAAASARQSVVSRRQALAEAESRVTRAETGLKRTKLTEAEARRRLDDTEIRADFDGRLTGVSVVEGGLVSANEELARLLDPRALEVAFQVSTTGYSRLLNDAGGLIPAAVTVTLDVFGEDITATGTLAREGAAVQEGQTGRTLYAGLDDAPAFRPGDFVTVEVTEPPLDRVARLPATALGPDGTVLALGPGDRLAAHAVGLLRRQGDDVLVRPQGLAGHEVVAERTPLLGPGIRVRPVRPEGDRKAAQAEAPDRDLVTLTPERRARLTAFIEQSGDMPEAARKRVLARLRQDKVPAGMVKRIERRMGG